MNRLRNIFTCLCPALWLTFGQGHAATVIWLDGFEANVPSRWTATGAWHIGSPTTGPYSGANCASTQNYLYDQDGRIVCTNYLNGSNSLVIPAASASPTLIFWHWVNLANALGYVELKSGTNGWQQISPTYLNVTSSGVWLPNSIDLSAFAGQSVQIAFHFTSGGCCGNAKGWYVDDVSLTVVVTTPPTLNVPDTQTIYAGQTLTVTNSATNSFLPNATYTFKLLSPPANASITRNGVLTWTTTTAQPPGTNTITVKVTDNSTPPLRATNSFVVVVVNPWAPVLTVPGPQQIYAGQPLTVTNYATNDFFPSSTFTFALLSGLTNVDANLDVSELTNNGVLSWATTTALKAGTYTNVIKVTDNDSPYFSATNRFVIVVSTNPPPPVLTVPPTQTIYAGRLLDITNISATNSAFPNDTYSYETNSAPAGVSIDPATGELTWRPTAAQAPSVNTISVKVTDTDYPTLSAIGSFLVIVSPTPPPPSLNVPSTQTNYAGQTLTVTIFATNIYLPDSVFTFSLPSASTNYWITTDGVLTWTNTGIRNGILTWTNNSVSPGTNLISVIVSDDSVPALSATNSFELIFLPPLPPSLNVPSTQTNYAGQTLTVTNFATNTYLPDSVFTFSLPSASTNYWITTNGVLTWTNTGIKNGVLTWTNNSVSPGTRTIPVKVTDNSNPPLLSTNSFELVFLPPLPPTLTVPTNQTIYVGRTFTVTNSATNTFLTNAIYTFKLPSPSTNVWITTNGVLAWTNTAVPPGTNLVSVKVTDNSVPPLSATNSFKVIVTPSPPVLIVSNLLTSSHSFQFSFHTLSNTTWRIDASTNLSSWLPLLTNTAGPSGTIQFIDLLATNYSWRFYRAVLQ
jgi:hypothetical protein